MLGMRQRPWELHLFISKQPRAVTNTVILQAAPNNDFEIQQQELIQTLQQQHLQHQAIIQGLQSQLQVQATVPLQT